MMKSFSTTIKSLILAVVLLISVGLVSAEYQAPTADPVGDNPAPFIDTGSTPQWKEGAVKIGEAGGLIQGLILDVWGTSIADYLTVFGFAEIEGQLITGIEDGDLAIFPPVAVELGVHGDAGVSSLSGIGIRRVCANQNGKLMIDCGDPAPLCADGTPPIESCQPSTNPISSELEAFCATNTFDPLCLQRCTDVTTEDACNETIEGPGFKDYVQCEWVKECTTNNCPVPPVGETCGPRELCPVVSGLSASCVSGACEYTYDDPSCPNNQCPTELPPTEAACTVLVASATTPVCPQVSGYTFTCIENAPGSIDGTCEYEVIDPTCPPVGGECPILPPPRAICPSGNSIDCAVAGGYVATCDAGRCTYDFEDPLCGGGTCLEPPRVPCFDTVNHSDCPIEPGFDVQCLSSGDNRFGSCNYTLVDPDLCQTGECPDGSVPQSACVPDPASPTAYCDPNEIGGPRCVATSCGLHLTEAACAGSTGSELIDSGLIETRRCMWDANICPTAVCPTEPPPADGASCTVGENRTEVPCATAEGYDVICAPIAQSVDTTIGQCQYSLSDPTCEVIDPICTPEELVVLEFHTDESIQDANDGTATIVAASASGPGFTTLTFDGVEYDVWTVGPPYDVPYIEIKGLAPGAYEYFVEVRLSDADSCTGETGTVVIDPANTVIECEADTSCPDGYVLNTQSNLCELTETIAATEDLICEFDLNFILDRSGSIDDTEAGYVHEFLTTLIGTYLRQPIENGSTAVGITAFTGNYGIVSPLQTGPGATDITLLSVDDMNRAGGGATNLNGGFCAARWQFDELNRPGYPRKTVMLTDGVDLMKSNIEGMVCNPEFHFTGSGYTLALAQFEKTRSEIDSNNMESLIIGIKPDEVRPNRLTAPEVIERWTLLHNVDANSGNAFVTQDFDGLTDPQFIEEVFLSTCDTEWICPDDSWTNNGDGTCSRTVTTVPDTATSSVTGYCALSDTVDLNVTQSCLTDLENSACHYSCEGTATQNACEKKDGFDVNSFMWNDCEWVDACPAEPEPDACEPVSGQIDGLSFYEGSSEVLDICGSPFTKSAVSSCAEAEAVTQNWFDSHLACGNFKCQAGENAVATGTSCSTENTTNVGGAPDYFAFVNYDCVPESCPSGSDFCPNIAGDQTTIPPGMQIDELGNCVEISVPPIDLCPNIAGDQTTIPPGMQIDELGNCVDIPPVAYGDCPRVASNPQTRNAQYSWELNGAATERVEIPQGNGNTDLFRGNDESFSVSAWVKLTTPFSNRIIAKDKMFGMSTCISNALCFLYGGSSGTDNLQAASAYTPYVNQWTHVVYTHNGAHDLWGGNAQMYVNGQPIETRLHIDSSGTPNLPEASAWIGRLPGVSRGMYGRIAEASFIDCQLEPEEVLQLYNNGRPLDITTASFAPAVVSHWIFDNTSDPTTILRDSIGRSDGIPQNMDASNIVNDAPGLALP